MGPHSSWSDWLLTHGSIRWVLWHVVMLYIGKVVDVRFSPYHQLALLLI